MTTQRVQIDLPDATYRRLQQRAAQMRQSVQEAAREVLVDAVEQADQLPPEFETALASLHQLADAELSLAARTRMPKAAADQLAQLNRKRQYQGLTTDETQTAASLLYLYERTMLVRAQAAVILKQRGFDITNLRDAA
jgi:plasmid stability protein